MQLDDNLPMPDAAPTAPVERMARILCVNGPLHARHVITNDKYVLCEGGAYELEASHTVPGGNVFVWQEKSHAVVAL